MEEHIDKALDALSNLLTTGEEDKGATKVTGKEKYIEPTEEARHKVTTDLKIQLKERHGDVIVAIGVGEAGETDGLSDEQMVKSLATIDEICAVVGATPSVLRKRNVEDRGITELLIRKRPAEDDFVEARVAVVGNVDSGKSTLLGVLTHDQLDDGRGKSRLNLFRHKHEADSGRTSSVAHDILGFDDHGKVVNDPGRDRSLNWTDICNRSAKVLTFIDLAGHERYLKTTVFGLTGHVPDFAMLMIGANAGIQKMTKEHLRLTLGLNVPVFVVITKIDMCPPNVLAQNLKHLQKVLKSPGCRKLPILVNTIDDAVVAGTSFVSERACPIFQVSNVTGENLDLLRFFLNLLTPRTSPKEDEPAEFQIDDTFSVPGVGTVASGITLSGIVRPNDTLLLGPDHAGDFVPVTIKGVHRHRLPCQFVKGGQMASFALKKVKRTALRKGMVLISPEKKPEACWEFQGEVIVLHHPTTIGVKYQAMVHCGSIKQTATILEMNTEHIRTGDRASIRFQFIKHPEFLKVGSRFVFREGTTKGVGTVTAIYPDTEAPLSDASTKQKHRSRRHHARAKKRQQGVQATTSSNTIEQQ